MASAAIANEGSGSLPERTPDAALARSVYILAAVAVFIHFLFNGKYGYFRDELYYAACGEHPAWGYVDHAPLVGAGLIGQLAGAEPSAYRVNPGVIRTCLS